MPGKQARHNEPPLSRAQSQIAARILRQEFDPSTHTHFPADSKTRLLGAVNAAFAAHVPPLPANYSYRKMEDWRANCVYRHKCRQNKQNLQSSKSAKRKRGSSDELESLTPPKSDVARPSNKKRSPKTPPRSNSQSPGQQAPPPPPLIVSLFSLSLTLALSLSLWRCLSLALSLSLSIPDRLLGPGAGVGVGSTTPQLESSEPPRGLQLLGDTTSEYPADTVLTIEEPCGGLYGLDAPFVIVDPVWAEMAGPPHPVAQSVAQRQSCESSSLYWPVPYG